MTPGVRVIGMVPGTGYGDGAADLALAIHQAGFPVSWRCVSDEGMHDLSREASLRYLPAASREILAQLLGVDTDFDRFLLSLPPPDWHTPWREALPALRPFCYAAWEVQRLPPSWPGALNQYEKIFVPSRFNRDAFMASGIEAPVEIIPHVLRPAAGEARVPELGQVRADDFLFYSIGAWTTRKALEQTLRAFLDTFSGDDPVAFVIKTEFTDRTVYEPLSKAEQEAMPEWRRSTAFTVARILGEYSKPARVHLINTPLPAAEIEGLHARGDCFLSLSHAEGWGMGAFDAAARNNPVIITGWGGQRDFLGDDYPLLVSHSLQPTSDYINDGYFYCASDVYWAQADSEHAGELMRSVLSGSSSLQDGVLARGEAIRARYAPPLVARDLAQAMGLES